MKQIILGTAGHIDHGKTALIRALTGTDTDRLKEEKERGITIELGFARLDLSGGINVGIVDVPGHEKFVKNMVAGATGIDLVAVVIAGDEGIMPQTREHLEICSLLGIEYGIIVLTKIDLVDREWVELVREEVSEFVADTFLGNAPIVEVSSQTGEGVKELLAILNELAGKIPERSTGNFFRLPVDRVFIIRGFGTVVTGTTISGKISAGSEVTIYPRGVKGKIRGIQVHNKDVSSASPGLRTAINLQGVEKEFIERGDVIAEKDSLRSSYMIDSVLTYLKSNPKGLKNRTRVRFHSGTSEIIGTAVLLDREVLKPGDRGFVQFRLERPTAVLSGDRFVIRSYSPVRTIGGGYILNPLPSKKKRFSKEALDELKVLDKGKDQEKIGRFVRDSYLKGINKKDLSFLGNMKRGELDRVIEGLVSENTIINYDPEREAFVHTEVYNKAREDILAAINHYHERFPLKEGLMKEELKSRMSSKLNERLFNRLLESLINESAVARKKDIIKAGDYQINLLPDQEKLLEKIEKLYQKRGLEPPTIKELFQQIPDRGARELLEIIVKKGTLVKVKDDLCFHRDSIGGLRERLIAFIRENGEIATPDLKKLTGVSRKFTIPLIEYFDKMQLTVRVGDKRVLRGGRQNAVLRK